MHTYKHKYINLLVHIPANNFIFKSTTVFRNYDDLNEAEKQHVRRFGGKKENQSLNFFPRYGWSRQLLAAAHPGYGTFHPRLHKKIYHMYYQWVFLFFCIQVDEDVVHSCTIFLCCLDGEET